MYQYSMTAAQELEGGNTRSTLNVGGNRGYSPNEFHFNALLEGLSCNHHPHRGASGTSGRREGVSTNERVSLRFRAKWPSLPELVRTIAVS